MSRFFFPRAVARGRSLPNVFDPRPRPGSSSLKSSSGRSAGAAEDSTPAPDAAFRNRGARRARSPAEIASQHNVTRCARCEAFPPGAMLGERYRIIGLLGRGGMGEVYRADDLKLGQAVALKFLPKAVSGDESLLGEIEGPPLPLDGVRGRRGPRVPPEEDRTPPGGEVRRDRAPALRRPPRGARKGRPPSRPQAGEHHARRARLRAHHGLRPRRLPRSSLRGERRRSSSNRRVSSGSGESRARLRVSPSMF